MTAALEIARAPALPSVAGFLAQALAAARGLVQVRMPAPSAPLEILLQSTRKTDAVLWSPPHGRSFACVGTAASVRADGPDRLRSVQAFTQQLFSRLRIVTHPQLTPLAPRVFGGLAFAPGDAAAEPWQGFGDGCFVLPRWSYAHEPAGATLTLALDAGEGLGERGALVRAELETIWHALEAPRSPRPRPHTLRVDHGDPRDHARRVDAIRHAIATEGIGKIVASRRTHVRAAHDLDPWLALARLARRYPDTWRFGVRLGQGVLVGASPERLVRKRGRTLQTDALAGSIHADAEDAEARLRASAKDLEEHRFVVRHLHERLAPLCASVEMPATPAIKRLPNVLHLHTPVRAVLHEGVHACALVEALHPTPAVCGTPSTAASAWIAENEPGRGWYGGVVGWIDASGDAELIVALRCGVVRGASAWLWAGGGIVEGSEPEAEWIETQSKLRPVLEALGGET